MEKLSHLNGDKQISDEVSQDQAQRAICSPTDIEINPLRLRCNECHHVTSRHSELFARWAEAVIIIKKETKLLNNLGRF